MTAASVTTTGSGDQLVGLFGAKGPVSFTPPSGMAEETEVLFGSVNGEKLSDESADQALSSSGATGSRVATASAVVYSIGQLVALRPGP